MKYFMLILFVFMVCVEGSSFTVGFFEKQFSTKSSKKLLCGSRSKASYLFTTSTAITKKKDSAGDQVNQKNQLSLYQKSMNNFSYFKRRKFFDHKKHDWKLPFKPKLVKVGQPRNKYGTLGPN